MDLRRLRLRYERQLTGIIVVLLCASVKWSSPQDLFFFDPAPESQEVREGDDALIRCDVSNRLMISFYWTYNGKILANTSRRFQEDSDLRILNVDRNLDNGSFRCVAVNSSTGIAVRSGEAKLHIFWLDYRVKVVQESPESDVISGSSSDLRLLCQVDASPEPAIDWFRNKIKLHGSDRIELIKDSVRISSVTSTDNGVYSCHARNEAGHVDSHDDFLLTRYGDGEQVPRLNSSTFTRSVIAKKYSSAVLHCQYLSGVPTNWYFNQLHLANTTKYHLLINGTLIVNHADEDDTGPYQCVGVEPNGASQTFVSTLQLAYLNELNDSSFDPRIPGPLILPIGSKFDIRCLHPKGLPPPKSRWLTPSGPVTVGAPGGRVKESADEGTLSIDRLQESDSGAYVCEVENLAGTRSRGVNLIVSITPRITKHPSSQSVLENDKVFFRCDFLATPSPATTVTWKKDGELIDLRSPRFQSNQGHLQVNSVLMTDQGDYTCVVSSKGHPPVASQTARLRVSKRLQFHPQPSDMSLELNSQSNISCHAEGDSPPVISWHRVGQTLAPHVQNDDAGSLVFSGVTRSDAGLYVCLATSKQGTINATIRVDYFLKPSFTIRPGNVTAAIGKALMIHCSADGEPAPTIHWDAVDPQQFNPVRFKVLGNGTLVISKVSEEDSGRYRCIADNKGGTDEQEIYLVAKDVLDDDADSGMATTIIIAVCSIAVYLGVMIALIIFCLVRRMKRQAPPQTIGGAHTCESTQLMRKTDKDALVSGGSKSDGDSRSQSTQNSHLPPKTISAFDLPSVSRQHLQVLGLLGKCQYGDVFLAHNLLPAAPHPLVSIKSLTSTSGSHQAEFQREIDVLSRVNHKHIARLTGVCCTLQPPILVIEYCEWGDLKQFLLCLNTEASRLIQATLTLAQQLEMCRQIAVGMDHLSANHLVHGDLAARNILVTPFLDLKISFLSLCRDIFAGDYVQYHDRTIPLRWMPPESVFYGELTGASDVWAFGVTILEIFQLGALPLAGKTSEELLLWLKTGVKLHTVPPHNCPEVLWRLVQRCTSSNVYDRPTFEDITKILDTLMCDSGV